MKPNTQVEKYHYEFSRYMTKTRWMSIWYQINELMRLKPQNILEIGPGNGLLKSAASVFGLRVDTLDHDSGLSPDFLSPISEMPFPNRTYDVVCAFQVLEHLPYVDSLLAFKEMARVSRKFILISLPDSMRVWRYQIHIPMIGSRTFLIPKPRIRMPHHQFDGQHYWEINTKNFPLSRIIRDLSQLMKLEQHYRIPENPRHRFFIFSRQ